MTAPIARPGLWLVASTVLGRPVKAAENPHVCGVTVTQTISRQPYHYKARDCSACAVRAAGQGGRP
ncbi:hypothetical protein ACGFI9_12230 [Micromonospora sp. NPDC048930]|uniref:hypothetical protein n=1 Tax=Micromonospora sp. NPDC048930 TaxID=3364261 RepID=UPI0037162730